MKDIILEMVVSEKRNRINGLRVATQVLGMTLIDFGFVANGYGDSKNLHSHRYQSSSTAEFRSNISECNFHVCYAVIRGFLIVYKIK